MSKLSESVSKLVGCTENQCAPQTAPRAASPLAVTERGHHRVPPPAHLCGESSRPAPPLNRLAACLGIGRRSRCRRDSTLGCCCTGLAVFRQPAGTQMLLPLQICPERHEPWVLLGGLQPRTAFWHCPVVWPDAMTQFCPLGQLSACWSCPCSPAHRWHQCYRVAPPGRDPGCYWPGYSRCSR